jgi:hypothetical protein
MNKRTSRLIVFLCLCAQLLSCGAARYIPEGSKSLGVFEGSFEGKLHYGSVRIELFQTPQGSTLFEGNFEGENVQWVAFVRGTVIANTLEGQFEGPFEGTTDSQLSADGNQMSGSFQFEHQKIQPDSGTWKAMKK